MTRRGRNTDRPLNRRSGPSRERRVVHIGAEGERTEVDYLQYLRDELIDSDKIMIQVVSSRNGLTPRGVVDALLQARDDSGRDEYWALFDRDQHSGIPEAFAKARRHSMHVAFSSPSFDLWLLLHFREFSGQQSGSSRVVHEKLRTCPAFARFGSDSKAITAQRIDALRAKHREAASRARRLGGDCCTDTQGHTEWCDPLRRDPSTDVWQLLEALGIDCG